MRVPARNIGLSHGASKRLRNMTVVGLTLTALALFVGQRFGDTPPKPGTEITSAVAEILQPREKPPYPWCLVVMEGRHAAYITSKTQGSSCQELAVGDEIEAIGTRVIGGGTWMPIIEADELNILPAGTLSELQERARQKMKSQG